MFGRRYALSTMIPLIHPHREWQISFGEGNPVAKAF